MNPIHGLTLTCALGDPVIRWSGLITLRLMGWFPPETAMEAEGTGRVWFVPSTFWKITMARKPENFQNCFCFADIFDRIRWLRFFMIHFWRWLSFGNFMMSLTLKRTFKLVSFGDVQYIGAERLPICLHVFCCIRSSLGDVLISKVSDSKTPT